MKSLNRKGFTLVGLLAVIVVLAIVMIIAMPNVLNAMSGAREGAFKAYAKKIMGAAQGQFASDELLNKLTTTATITATAANKFNNTNSCYGSTAAGVNGTNGYECYCYPMGALGFDSGNTYKGYVVVVLDKTTRSPSYFITLTDKNQSFKDMTLSSIDSSSTVLAASTYDSIVNCVASNTAATAYPMY